MLTQQLTTSGRTPSVKAEDLVLTTITNHADELLRTARRHSLCADDASDGLEPDVASGRSVEAWRATGGARSVSWRRRPA